MKITLSTENWPISYINNYCMFFGYEYNVDEQEIKIFEVTKDGKDMVL